jgi:hypothetical protein
MQQKYNQSTTESALVGLNFLKNKPDECEFTDFTTSEEPDGITGVFPENVFENLPPFLKECTSPMIGADKDVVLLGTITVLSAVINIKGAYFGRSVYPNVFSFVIAPPGSGKGSLYWPEKLIMPIHKELREQSERQLLAWSIEASEAKRENKPEPPRPQDKRLLIAGNSAKSALIKSLQDNGGNGLLYESEADSLTDTLKSSWADFSDLLRKAFHHESIRRMRNDEANEIEHPRLSLLLAGTPLQLIKLIPTTENGLFSRFLFLKIEPRAEFNNPFGSASVMLESHFNELGKSVLLWYSSQVTDASFSLTDNQQRIFTELFQKEKTDEAAGGPEQMHLVHRRALLAYRVSMVLTAIRNFYKCNFSASMQCSDVDFNNAIEIVRSLKIHSSSLMLDLPQTAPTQAAIALRKEIQGKSDLVMEARQLFKEGKSYSEIAAIVLGNPKLKATIFRWINAYTKK